MVIDKYDSARGLNLRPICSAIPKISDGGRLVPYGCQFDSVWPAGTANAASRGKYGRCAGAPAKGRLARQAFASDMLNLGAPVAGQWMHSNNLNSG